MKYKIGQIVTLQLVGYLLVVLILPITICVFEYEFSSGKSYMTFPIVSFIVWLMLVVLPVLYAYCEKLRYRYICCMVLLVPPIVVFMIGMVYLLINLISLI